MADDRRILMGENVVATEMNTVELATELTIAWLGNPNTRTTAEDVPAVLRLMHDAVAKLLEAPEEAVPETASPEYTPAVTARKSLASKEHIISLIDGKPYKTLRRHLSTHGLTPGQYRERYNLKADYPMVAEAYSETRRAMAKRIGLGRKPGPRPVAPVEPVSAKPRRKSKAPAPAAAE